MGDQVNAVSTGSDRACVTVASLLACVVRPEESSMNPMHVLAGIVAAFLLVYLVVAMLKPEIFP